MCQGVESDMEPSDLRIFGCRKPNHLESYGCKYMDVWYFVLQNYREDAVMVWDFGNVNVRGLEAMDDEWYGGVQSL